MIDEIQVENLALIKTASLQPCDGLTVLTGETGAGKTALLSACKLLAGERADKSLIRDGEAGLSVSGRLYVRDPYAGEGAAAEEDADPEHEVVVLRKINADGRSRVTINGAMASASELAALVAPTMDLCGQHEHQLLMKPANHRLYLDAWAADEIAAPLAVYEQAFHDAGAAKNEYRRVTEAAALSAAQLEEARFTLRRIDEVDPQEGEYEDLQAALAKAQNAEALAFAATSVHESLSDDGAALDSLNAAVFALDSATRYDKKLSTFSERLREAVFLAEDVSSEMRKYRDSVEFDPAELMAMQERANAIQGLLRMFGPRVKDVRNARANAADIVSLVDDAEERLAAAQKALDAAEAALAQAAQALDAARCAAAPRFAAAVTAQMQRLCMGDAQLVCQVTPLERSSWTKQSPSAVEFLFKPGSDMQPRPFARIASGGEISRVMLALKVVLGATDQVSTLIFDEVDAGVGGATALALADVLAELATTHQVIVVTHLAQIAVRAQAHFVVRKSEGAAPETTIQEVIGEARVAEIARMLSGELSDASLAHARELLQER